MASQTARAVYERAHPKKYKRKPKPIGYDCRAGRHRLVKVEQQPGAAVYQCIDCGETRMVERRDHERAA